MKPSEISFDTLCALFEAMKGRSKHETKRKLLAHFIEQVVDRSSGEAFDIFRLIVPRLDTARGNYHLQEAKLASAFVEAAGLAKNDPQAKAVTHYRNPRLSKDVAGDFATVMYIELFKKYAQLERLSSKDPRVKTLKVGDINAKLDELASSSGNTKAQITILRYFLQRATASHMRWLTLIILKDLKLGLGEGSIFKEWHPDAQQYYDVCGQDLRAVFNTMTDKSMPFNASITLGKPIRPQLATTVYSAAQALQALRGKRARSDASASSEDRIPTTTEFIIETKIDGERIQVHCLDESMIQYYSRRSIEHGERSKYTVMDNAIKKALSNTSKPMPRCILDGEMVVWNKKRQRMEPFGTLKGTVHAAVAGLPSSFQLSIREEYGGSLDGDGELTYVLPELGDLELVYVVFDILALGDTPLTGLPLLQRLKILEDTVDLDMRAVECRGSSHICSKVIPLIPNKTRIGGILASYVASTEQEISAAIVSARVRREEGIVIKALDGQWVANDRSLNWLKCKPDYLEGATDIDAVILGGWYGGGHRGGKIAMWLMGLPSGERGEGQEFVTFCRVGTGLTEGETAALNERLSPLFVEAGAPNFSPSFGVKWTGKEKPDVWIKDPSASIVLELLADVRLIHSDTYASRLSLRFPRITRVRYDKRPEDATNETLLHDNVERQLQMRKESDTSLNLGGWRKGGRRTQHRPSKRPKVGAVSSIFLPDEPEQIEGDKKVIEGGEEASCKSSEGERTRYEEEVADATAVEENDVLTLQGAKVYVLFNPPSQKRVKSQALTEWHWKKRDVNARIRALGASLWAAYSPTVTHVVAASNDERLERFIKLHPERDVFTVEWLMSDNSSRQPPGPAQYLYLASPSNDLRDRYGDYYFVESTYEDVAALLERHVARHVPQDVPSPSTLVYALCKDVNDEVQYIRASGHTAGVEALRSAMQRVNPYSRGTVGRQTVLSSRTLLEYFDGAAMYTGKKQQQQQDRSLDKRGSFLHECIIMLVDIECGSPLRIPADQHASPSPGMSSWVLTAQHHHARVKTVLSECRMQRASALARGLGARIFELGIYCKEEEGEDAVRIDQITHIVAVGGANDTDCNVFNAILDAVQRVVKGSRGQQVLVPRLRERMLSGGVAVMSEEWLEAVFKAVASRQHYLSLDELEASHALLDASQLPPIPLRREKINDGSSDGEHAASASEGGMISEVRKLVGKPSEAVSKAADTTPSGPPSKGFNILSLLQSSGSDSERETDTRIKSVSPVFSPLKQVDSHRRPMSEVGDSHASETKSKVSLKERLAELRRH